MKRWLLFICQIFFSGFLTTVNAQYNFNLIRTFGETRHQIVFSAYSKDGTLIVTAGSDSSLIVWNAEQKTIYRTLTGLKARPNSAIITSNNRFLISGGKDNIATLWDLSVIPPKTVRTFEGHKGPIKSLDITPDGKLLATGSEDKSIRIWDVESASLLFELRGHSKDVNCVTFSADGKIMASGGADGVINLWNTSNGSKTASVQAHKGYIRELKFSSDGKLLASCGDDKMVNTWQIPALTKNGTFQGHKDRVQTIDFSPDGKNIISGGWDRLIILWDVSTQKVLAQSERQKQIVVSVNISPLKPDFISSCYESEDLDTWVISGLDEKQFNRQVGDISAPLTENVIYKTDNKAANENTKKSEDLKNLPVGKPMIEIFSPIPVNGKIVHDKNNIVLIGRVYDSMGVNTFLINKKPVKFSDVGVFQYSLNLKKGDNLLDLIAINNRMRMDEQQIIVTCTSEEALAEASEVTDISKSRFYGLIIGIDNYQDQTINHLDRPIKDAESLYNVLLTKYTFEKDNMIFLKDPTLDQITTTLEGLSKKLTENDNLLIFYAGHGYWDSRGNIGYWLPSDATRGSTVRWFRNSALRDFIASMQARHVMLIADACFSGAIFKTRGLSEEIPTIGIEKLYERQSRKAMTSGVLELVPDESIFVNYLVRRLNENNEKFLTAEQLFSSFKMAVMDNGPTTPLFGTIQNVGDDSGDFVFVKK